MPRRTIQFVKGGYYHVYNRGAARLSIVREERNYTYLLQLMKQVSAASNLAIIAYCLLPNHYHWLVRQDGDTPVSALPKRVFGSYSQAFNKAYGRSGTLFEGTFHATSVDTEAYLRHLCRYIHTNAVKHGLAPAPELWPYSNYLEWVGERDGTLVDRQFVEAYFETSARYRAFVSEYLSRRAALSHDLIQLEKHLEDL